MYQQDLYAGWSSVSRNAMATNHMRGMVPEVAGGSSAGAGGLSSRNMFSDSFLEMFDGGVGIDTSGNQYTMDEPASIPLQNSEFNSTGVPVMEVDDERLLSFIRDLSQESPKEFSFMQIKTEVDTESEELEPCVPLEEISARLDECGTSAPADQGIKHGLPSQSQPDKIKRSRKSNLVERVDTALSNGIQFCSEVSTVPPMALPPVALPPVALPPVMENYPSASKLKAKSSTKGRGKKPKMYEKVGDPKCRNAFLAKANRLKKEQAEQALVSENKIMKLENSKLKLEKEQLTAELNHHRRLSQSFVGLQQLFPSVSTMMESVMMSLEVSSNDKWKVQTPPWFGNVPASSFIEFDENHASLSADVAAASKYITLHINPTERIVQMDYNPDEPNVLNHFYPSVPS